MELIDRARAALDGNGESGMYDDYDQACQWSGLVRELVEYAEGWRENYRECLKVMIANGRVIGQLRDECGLTMEYVDAQVDAAIAEARTT